MIQLQFLNYILNSKDVNIITSNNLTIDFFSDYSAEFTFIKQHIQQYGCIPDITVFLNAFPRFELLEINDNPKYLLAALQEDHTKRALAKTFNEIREALNNGDTKRALHIFEHSQESVKIQRNVDSVDIFKDLSRYDAYAERINNFNKFYVKTGFDELDQIIGGWDREEDLVTIVARTNQGKSWILDKCAIAAAQQGLRVGIYSGEMSVRKVGYRIDTLISHLSNTKIIHGNPDIQNDYRKFLEDTGKTLKGSIKVITPDLIDGPAGVNALRAFIEKDQLDMLCIDQHSLLEDDRGAKNPVERASNISRDLKNLQTLKHIPILAVSQQNRNSTENGVDSSHVAQSDRISQDSTVLIFLEQKDGVMTLYLTKSRDSANGKTLKYALDLDKGIFNYIPSENDANPKKNYDDLKSEFEYEESPF